MVDAEGISPMITEEEEKEDILRCNEFNSPCFLTEILVGRATKTSLSFCELRDTQFTLQLFDIFC